MMPPKELDTDYARSHFPGLAQGWTFFDNAGGTQILAGVVERLNEFLLNRNVQTGGTYEVSLRAAESLMEGRRAMQQFVNAERPEEIVFAPSATVALQNLARALRGRLAEGDEIIVTISDHESNIGPWVGLEDAGVRVRFWNVDPGNPELDLDELDALMNERTRLVAVTLTSNILGTVNPVADIAARVHAGGAELCVDAVAYAPHRLIDVRAMGVDYLVFALYKTYGPHYAVMYGRYELLAALDNLYHYFYGRDKTPARLEPGNASYELAYSATGIVDYLADLGRRAVPGSEGRQALAGAFDAITAHECALAETLLAFLRDRDDCRIIGRPDGTDPGRVPTISFKVAGRLSSDIARQMDAYNIAIRYGDFHARRLAEHLELGADGAVRVSMVHYNTVAEVEALVDALGQILDHGP